MHGDDKDKVAHVLGLEYRYSNFALWPDQQPTPFGNIVHIRFPGTVRIPCYHTVCSSLDIDFSSYHAMTQHHFRNIIISLELFAVLARCACLNYTGEALTTRFWDCCKPSCGWVGKADFSSPVVACTADDKPTDLAAGTGCKGGNAFQCSNQQPWAINDTLSYGYAGVFITSDLTGGGIEGCLLYTSPSPRDS